MPGPPPPPPPMMAAPKKFVPLASGSGDPRNALLGQIQKGAKLKKVQTVDKSGPLVAGKAVGDSGKPASRGPSSTRTSPDTPTASPLKKPPGGFANLTEELQFKMTLKKNKNSPVKESNVVAEPKEPSPPASSKSFVNEIKSKQSVITAHHTPSQAPSPNPSDAIANKSSLFNKTAPSFGAAPMVLNPPKVINHGKPNLAPRPPPQLKLVTSGNNNNNNSLNGDSNRKSVARHQSMKSPRSPPTALSPSGPFTSDNHFGTMRMNSSNQQKIHDAINPSPIQKPAAQRPTNKPPPPPVPNRFPGTNLSNNHAKSTNALNLSMIEQTLSAPRKLPSSGSSNNISNMDRSADVSDSSAPPLPPHRMSSQTQLRAPPTPVLPGNPAPPEVPRRHSSMRNSIENGANGKYASPNPNQQPITRLVVDLEARYSLLFHNVSEFPQPHAFMNLDKSYPSRVGRLGANGI